jgi:hypothetical protein
MFPWATGNHRDNVFRLLDERYSGFVVGQVEPLVIPVVIANPGHTALLGRIPGLVTGRPRVTSRYGQSSRQILAQ